METNSINKKTVINECIWICATFVILIAIMLLTSTLFGNMEETNKSMPMWVKLIIGEAIIPLPGIIYAIVKKLNIRKDLGFQKIKGLSILFAFILAFLLTPVVSFINVLTQLFVPNTMTQASTQLVQGSPVLIILITGFFAPFCEELMFRSIYYNRLATIVRPMIAGVISGLLFGIMHMNFNQGCYAFVLGVLLSIINVASGSVYTSMIIHTVINTSNMCVIFLMTALYSSMGMDLAQSAETVRTGGMIGILIVVYFFLALAGGGISIPIIIQLAKGEGHLDELKAMFSRKKNKSEE